MTRGVRGLRQCFLEGSTTFNHLNGPLKCRTPIMAPVSEELPSPPTSELDNVDQDRTFGVCFRREVNADGSDYSLSLCALEHTCDELKKIHSDPEAASAVSSNTLTRPTRMVLRQTTAVGTTSKQKIESASVSLAVSLLPLNHAVKQPGARQQIHLKARRDWLKAVLKEIHNHGCHMFTLRTLQCATIGSCQCSSRNRRQASDSLISYGRVAIIFHVARDPLDAALPASCHALNRSSDLSFQRFVVTHHHYSRKKAERIYSTLPSPVLDNLPQQISQNKTERDQSTSNVKMSAMATALFGSPLALQIYLIAHACKSDIKISYFGWPVASLSEFSSDLESPQPKEDDAVTANTKVFDHHSPHPAAMPPPEKAPSVSYKAVGRGLYRREVEKPIEEISESQRARKVDDQDISSSTDKLDEPEPRPHLFMAKKLQEIRQEPRRYALSAATASAISQSRNDRFRKVPSLLPENFARLESANGSDRISKHWNGQACNGRDMGSWIEERKDRERSANVNVIGKGGGRESTLGLLEMRGSHEVS
ncbi:uncharacterized protein MYCFIDRAFT_172497 [Pseudocercospora fijiensis CIRAD86]|uniref:Uncharacterized protein n=1 Tax=Pseudocercospora fijiensis (strain CIRAD86) TaxID=383855 RepID=M3BC07_PSEFD|nr:uncharacterized protein MYCFIDRAFT_172497 [Pseudocercospora fijiensis CIRAD86]EME86807.1 hypothetical protein MYCFIDRAFT_172497 [Pseudocercospora fijiensis CIRAD86]